MSRFGAIKSERLAQAASPGALTEEPVSEQVTGRTGKKAISGYFSPELSRGLHRLALDLGVSLQALMGEAFDDLLRKYRKHPFGER
jgi:hypothetical protein